MHVIRITETKHKRNYCVNQLDSHATDNVIIQCTDDGASDNRVDNYPISNHHQVIGRRRYRTVSTTTNKCEQWLYAFWRPIEGLSMMVCFNHPQGHTKGGFQGFPKTPLDFWNFKLRSPEYGICHGTAYLLIFYLIW